MSAGITRATAKDMQNEAEIQLRHQIRDAIALMKDDKKSVDAVRSHVGGLKSEMFSQSGWNGVDCAKRARQRIRERKQKELTRIEMFKNSLSSAGMSPMVVAKLSQLVSVGNTEIPNSYMIVSQLSDKDDARIKRILRDGNSQF